MKEIILIIIISLLFIFLLFFTNYHSKLFLPSKKLSKFYENPSEENVVNGVSISAFWNNTKGKTILFCHGNYGNITNRNYMIKFAKNNNLNLILFDYFGYGKSQGIPSTHRILKNADTVLEWTLQKVKDTDLIIWGESLGGSTAAYIASKNTCKKLILFATFSSLDDLCFGPEKIKKWYHKPMKIFFEYIINLLPTKNWVKETKCETMIFHSSEDELIPYDLAEQLQSIDESRIKLISIKGGHSSPKVTKENIYEMLKFCEIENIKEDIIDECFKIFDNIIYEEDW
jgi:hypothetical protein